MRLRLTARSAAPTFEDVPSLPRQLADRLSDGHYVQLLWHPADDSVSVAVDDRRTGVRLECPVPREQALFAFNHPFVFAG